MSEQTFLEFDRYTKPEPCPVCGGPVASWIGVATCSLKCDDTFHSIDYRFSRFHEKNPEVYDELVAMARMQKQQGRKKSGIGALFELLRWKYSPTTGEPYKLPNDLRSRYARLIMEQEEDLHGFFDIRSLRSE